MESANACRLWNDTMSQKEVVGDDDLFYRKWPLCPNCKRKQSRFI